MGRIYHVSYHICVSKEIHKHCKTCLCLLPLDKGFRSSLGFIKLCKNMRKRLWPLSIFERF